MSKKLYPHCLVLVGFRNGFEHDQTKLITFLFRSTGIKNFQDIDIQKILIKIIWNPEVSALMFSPEKFLQL